MTLLKQGKGPGLIILAKISRASKIEGANFPTLGPAVILTHQGLPKVIGAPEVGKHVQKLPLTLTARQFTQK